MTDDGDMFLGALADGIRDNTFVKLTLGKYRGGESGLRKVMVKPVTLSRGEHLCFVQRYADKDVTKNLALDEGLARIRELLGVDFLSANLFATTGNIELVFGKRQQTRLRFAKPTHTAAPSRKHNRTKHRPITQAGTPYLTLLGVTGKDGAVKRGMEAKYRQINKFIEIVDHLLRSAPLGKADALRVMDMGSGKGYLTFALYDYLTNTLKKQAEVTGVEARPHLVDLCNNVASAVGYTHLHFACGTIQNAAARPTDILIALHACDTATDEALAQAVKAETTLVLCAPCCHKELRPQMRCAIPGLATILEFGILLERQSELVTDGLRALLLEAAGYKTRVFEFIATEHTSKNLMIAGIKSNQAERGASRAQIEALKKAFGIDKQRLETLLADEV